MSKPTVVCICGSTRFSEQFQAANFKETLDGKIVLTIGCDLKSDAELFGGWGTKEVTAIKAKLDDLHLRKIDLADEILVLNVGQYIGSSTRHEIEYAKSMGKRIRYLVDPDGLLCESCEEEVGTFNSSIWKMDDGTGDGHWVCYECEMEILQEHNCPCGCDGPDNCVYNDKTNQEKAGGKW